MISFNISCSDNGAALNDYFIIIRPKHSDHVPGTRAEIFDEKGVHFLGFATIKTRSTIAFESISDTLSLCFMAKPATEVKSFLKSAFLTESDTAVDILALEWIERNVDACVTMQSIQYEKILHANKQPSPAMLVKLTQTTLKYVQA